MKRYSYDANVNTGDVKFYSPPLKGLRTDSSLLGLSPEYAYQLDNVVVQPDGIITRRGFTEWATDLTGTEPSFHPYTASAASKLFVRTSTGIYDATSVGSVGAAVRSSTKGSGSSTNFGTSAGQYILMVNGADDPELYDGSTWKTLNGSSTPALTGIADVGDLNFVTNYRQRLYFLANNFLGFYYLPVDSIAGALQIYRLGSISQKGGKAVAIATWTADGGDGQDDFMVVATSEGEVFVFFGSDPGSASAWDLRGVYTLGKPLGPNCFVRFGGDLLYLSEDGVAPLSASLISASINKRQNLTIDIADSMREDVERYRNLYGWQMLVIPERSLLMVNVPSDPPRQYIRNTLSNGWSRFLGMEASAWVRFGDDIYFVTDTAVFQAFVGASDNGAQITFEIKTAFDRFRKTEAMRPILVRPYIAQDGKAEYTVGFATNFVDSYENATLGSVGAAVAEWDSALWDVGLWGGTFELRKDWETIPAVDGMSLSMRIAGASDSVATVFLGADVKLSKPGLVF